MPEFLDPSLSLKEMVELRDALRRKEHFHANEDRHLELLGEGVTAILEHIADLVPKTVAASPFTIPQSRLAEPRQAHRQPVCDPVDQRYVDAGLFIETTRRMYFNLCAASDIADPQEPKRPFKPAASDAPPVELVETYFTTPASSTFSTRPACRSHTTRRPATWTSAAPGQGRPSSSKI